MNDAQGLIQLVDGEGVEADILPFGAALQSLRVRDREGRTADVVLGHASVEGYRAHRNSFFGVTIGRVANRIAKGSFSLDGQAYRIAANNGPNALHGGLKGFDTAVWRLMRRSENSVQFGYASPDGDEGFPGSLEARVSYSLEGNALVISYEARCDRPTIVNLTNHSYFNLAGEASSEGILDHVLTLEADSYLPVDATAIPLGAEAPVKGTAFDFRAPAALRARVLDLGDPQIAIGGGIDHNFCLRGGVTVTPRLAATVYHPGSGRVMTMSTTTPGVQVYSGNFLDGSIKGKTGRPYPRHHALCLECQHYPDSPNQPNFPSIRLDPGEVYRQTTIYAFSNAAG
ncbi:MAG: aldose epimerase family protein [Methylocella sp.]